MGKGEIYLARFPFGGTVGIKVRPVLLLTSLVGPVPEVLAAYMTSVAPSALLPTDLVLDPSLPEHASTNLTALSIVRLHKLATLHQRDVHRLLGTLSATTIAEVDSRLRILLGL
jgi:mRNA-degrading endonuclease toxin of MazEF toxin-antitoxin module